MSPAGNVLGPRFSHRSTFRIGSFSSAFIRKIFEWYASGQYSWFVTALKESHAEEKRHHDESVARLQKQHQTLQNRLDAMYVDKLDDKITQEFFDRQSVLWREEQSKLLAQITAHQSANVSYIDSGVKILELAQRAGILYETQSMQEKRRILRFVLGLEGWSP